MGILKGAPLLGATRYRTKGVLFNGTNESLFANGVLSATDSKTGTFSAWFNAAGSDSSNLAIWESKSGARNFCWRGDDGKMDFLLRNTSGATLWHGTSTSTYLSGTGWHNILVSYDLTLASPTVHMYVDGVDDKDTDITGPIGLQNVDMQDSGYISRRNDAGGRYFDGALADIYYNYFEYIDLSVASNRAKFIDGSGRPVFLGADGSLPTGSAPEIFLHLDRTETDPDNFKLNLGNGGDFTVINGPLALSSDNPTD